MKLDKCSTPIIGVITGLSITCSNFILLEDIGSTVVQNNISDQSIISVLEAL